MWQTLRTGLRGDSFLYSVSHACEPIPTESESNREQQTTANFDLLHGALGGEHDVRSLPEMFAY